MFNIKKAGDLPAFSFVKFFSVSLVKSMYILSFVCYNQDNKKL